MYGLAVFAPFHHPAQSLHGQRTGHDLRYQWVFPPFRCTGRSHRLQRRTCSAAPQTYIVGGTAACTQSCAGNAFKPHLTPFSPSDHVSGAQGCPCWCHLPMPLKPLLLQALSSSSRNAERRGSWTLHTRHAVRCRNASGEARRAARKVHAEAALSTGCRHAKSMYT